MTQATITSRFKAFREKYLGAIVNDSCTSSYAQCVDLMARWQKALGKRCTTGYRYAYQAWDQIDSTQWRKVKNTPSGVPPIGALVFFRPHPGQRPQAGHVAIARAGCTSSRLLTLDQNWSARNRTTDERHVWDYVIGWAIAR